jgi:hypothetical protein
MSIPNFSNILSVIRQLLEVFWGDDVCACAKDEVGLHQCVVYEKINIKY